MASFDAAVNVVIKNEQSLARVIKKIESLSGILKKLNSTPVDLFGKTSGIGGDIFAKQLGVLKGKIREVANSSDDAAKRVRLLGNTVAETSSRASTFANVLQNVGVKSGGLARQTGEVKTLAAAWGLAEAQAEEYEERLAKIQADSLKQGRTALGRDPDPQKTAQTRRQVQLEKEISQEKFKQFYEAKRAERVEAKINAALQKRAALEAKNQKIRQAAGNALSSGLISGAFPLITGAGGLESGLGALGGVTGGLFGGLGGFAGGIAGSAVGRLVTEAQELDRKLRDLNVTLSSVGSTSNITAGDIDNLAKQLGIAKDEAIQLVGGFNAIADQSAVKDLTRAFGAVGDADTAVAIVEARLSEADALKSIERLQGVIGIENAENLKTILETNGAEAASAALLEAILEKAGGFREESKTTLGIWERIQAAIGTIATFTNLNSFGQILTPEEVTADKNKGIVAPDKGILDTALDRYEDFLRRRNALNEKFNPKGGGRSGSAPSLPESQALRLTAQINQETVKRIDLQTKYMSLFMSETEALKLQNERAQTKLRYQSEILELQRQQALATSKYPGDEELINKLYDSRLTTLIAQNELFKEQNNLRLNAIALEKELLDLTQKQTLAGIGTDLGRQIDDANMRGTGNTQYDQEIALRIKQMRRLEDVTIDYNNLIEKQRAIIDSPNSTNQQILDADDERQRLKEQLQLRTQLLGQLDQAEQAQLRYNQVLQAAQPYAEAFATGLTQGLRDVVAGTKTAEEAFADFLNNIADLLIQTAATMIAQYIAIGIAKAFAGMGSQGQQVNKLGFDLGKLSTLPLAEGGYVNRPTPALIGEGGEPEYVIPASKMNESMARYSAGSRGNSVVPNNATGGGNSPSPGGAAPLFNLQTQVINNVEYATVQDVRAMGAQATSAGAKQGEARVMSSLKNSRSKRARVGL